MHCRGSGAEVKQHGRKGLEAFFFFRGFGYIATEEGCYHMDKCFYCKGEMKDGFCNYMADLDGHFIIIKNVPCHKCCQCGEVSYSGEVVVRIEEIVKKLKEALTEVAIVEYAA